MWLITVMQSPALPLERPPTAVVVAPTTTMAAATMMSVTAAPDQSQTIEQKGRQVDAHECIGSHGVDQVANGDCLSASASGQNNDYEDNK